MLRLLVKPNCAATPSHDTNSSPRNVSLCCKDLAFPASTLPCSIALAASICVERDEAQQRARRTVEDSPVILVITEYVPEQVPVSMKYAVSL